MLFFVFQVHSIQMASGVVDNANAKFTREGLEIKGFTMEYGVRFS